MSRSFNHIKPASKVDIGGRKKILPQSKLKVLFCHKKNGFA